MEFKKVTREWDTLKKGRNGARKKCCSAGQGRENC